MGIPGVPPLLLPPGLNRLNTAVNTATLITADVGIVSRLFQAPKWGVYLNGKPVAVADSVVTFEYRRESRISNYPQEDGAFQSYNKVAYPFQARVQMNKGGSEVERTAFLESIDTAAGDLNQYDVVTPEITYTGTNIERYDYRRTARNGVGLVTVDLWLVQIRGNATTTFVATKTPSGANATFDGRVQTQTPTAAQVNQVGPTPAFTGGATGSWVPAPSTGGATGSW